MKRYLKTYLAIPIFSVLASPSPAADWPQLGGNPQHTCYSPEDLSYSFTYVWRRGFQPDQIYPSNQPIIVGKRLFIGTEGGVFYCLNADTGSTLWTYTVGRTILGAAAVSGDGQRVYFAAMNGHVYALSVVDGSLVWDFNSGLVRGFSAGILLANNRVYAANRGGTLFALNDSSTLSLSWQKSDFGCALLQTPAYNNGRVFIAGMDMRLNALDSSTGAPLWRTDPLPGLCIDIYWPVVHAARGIVVERPAGLALQFEAYSFNEADGSRVSLSLLQGNVHRNAGSSPGIDRDGQFVVGNGGGASGFGAYGSSYYRVDPNSGLATHILDANNADENQIISTAGRWIFVAHLSGLSQLPPAAWFNGAYDLNTGQLIRFDAQGSADPHYVVQSAGASPLIAANGHLYHLAEHGIGCLQ